MTGREPRWLRRLVVDEAHWSYSPGVGLTASNGDAHLAVLAVAARDMTETELIDWIDAHSRTS